MNIRFLGTGTSQGIPVIGSDHPVCHSADSRDKRLRVSVLVHWGDHSYVIDCGPDFRQQMLAAHCRKLDGILFTHEHADHTAGLDDIRPYNFRQGAMPVFAHDRVLSNLRQRFDYIFTDVDRYPGAPSVKTIEIRNNEPFAIGDKVAVPVEVWHAKLQVFGFRIDDFAYLTDVKIIFEEEVEKLRNLKVLVVNALREEPHDSHFNLQEALDFINLVQPERAYLTHISHMMGFHAEVEQKLPPNVFLAYDNLEIQLP